MAQLLTSLDGLVQYNRGRIDCLVPVVMNLCEPKIAGSVQYDYPELVRYFVNCFLEFY